MSIFALVFVLLVLGLLAWGVESSPITNATFKTFIVWALMIVGAVLLIAFIANVLGIDTGFQLPKVF